MWADFEWENKVTVNTNVSSLPEFVAHIARVTNMRVLTPIPSAAASGPAAAAAVANAEGGDRGAGATANFLAANLYARSIFGEDALVNVSVENKPDGSIKGHIRIRAKTQGVALSLGDRITSKQKA
jgi:coatomer subunit beta